MVALNHGGSPEARAPRGQLASTSDRSPDARYRGFESVKSFKFVVEVVTGHDGECYRSGQNVHMGTAIIKKDD